MSFGMLPNKAFFQPRLVHFHSQYEQTPGLIVSDWRRIELSWAQTILRRAFYRVRNGRASPLGLSKLPFELLDMIFGKLCGKEVHAIRLTCTEWDLASRPFFAERHLKRSLFWLTASDLRRLKRLAAKFGPYMGTVYITTDHFTFSGLWQIWVHYKEHRDYLNELTALTTQDRGEALLTQGDSDAEETEVRTPFNGYVAQPLRNEGMLGSRYFRHACVQHRPLSPWRHLRLWPFLWHALCSTITQRLLRCTGLERRMLAQIAEMLPRGQLEAVRVEYAAEKLIANENEYGRASPHFACEVALLCVKADVLHDAEYEEHVETLLRKVIEGKNSLHTRRAEGQGRTCPRHGVHRVKVKHGLVSMGSLAA